MPFPLIYGELPKYDRHEFSETGLLTESVSFTPEQEIKVKKKHAPGNLGLPGQVQVWRGSLGIELKGAIIPDEGGNAIGLAAVYPGQAVTCFHFAAGTDAAPAIPRHGFIRKAEMLLMVEGPKTELGAEEPAVTVPMRYFDTVSNQLVAIAA